MKKKLILTIMMCAVLLFSMSVNALAFSDISDEKTASAVASLESLGIINGFPDGTFRPNESLTRAQFTKMAVLLKKDAGDQLTLAASSTIFPDVKSNNWAVSYINYATKTAKIINGYPNGYFYPANEISYAEAVTILMRQLGYTDASVGMVWPDGYLSTAALCGLTDGLNLQAKDSITRADAALLFNNMLSCNVKEGKTSFLASICPGGIMDGVILVSNSSIAADGTTGALKVLKDGIETVYKTTSSISSVLLNKIVTLALDKNGAVMAVLPTGEANYKSFILSSATSSALKGADGSNIVMASNATVVLNGEQLSYSTLYLDLRAGASVNVYYNATGKIQKIYIDTAKGGEAAVLTTAFPENSNPFIDLFGLSQNEEYKIIKNGSAVTASALRLYDVAIYNAGSKTFFVSDVKLSGVYESVKGAYGNPSEIFILGNWFPLASCAQSSVASFKPAANAQVTVLLTADNRVAGMYTQGTAFSKEIGIAKPNVGKLELSNGIVLAGVATNGTSFGNLLASAYSNEPGTITYTTVVPVQSKYAFDVKNRKVGDFVLSDSVVIYDSINGLAVTKITVDDIPVSIVAAEQIYHIVYDTAGKVSLLVLDNVTGDCYTYGQVTAAQNDLNFVEINGTSYPTYQQFSFGEYCGVVVGPSGYVDGKLILSKLSGLTTSDFISNKQLQVGTSIYPVASNVTVYLAPLKKVVTLFEARSYGGNVEAYYDKPLAEGGKIHFVVVK